MPILEQFFRPIARGPGTFAQSLQALGANQFAGSTLVASGTAVVTVSTSLVKSTSIIPIIGTLVAADPTSTNAGHFAVSSIVDGKSFDITRVNSVPAPFGETVYWTIMQTGTT